MIRSLQLLCVFTLFATTAGAVGCDLSIVACPGTAGSALEFGIDCASGEVIPIYATFQPNEAIADLNGIDATLSVWGPFGPPESSTFWNFAGANASALSFNPVRPNSVCNLYRNTWSEAGLTSSFVVHQSPAHENETTLEVSIRRVTPIAVALNSKNFGFQLLLDAAQAVEGTQGGTLQGCGLPAVMDLYSLRPNSASGATTTPLMSGSVTYNCVSFNNAWPSCVPDPARRSTWGQLKSLYR